MIERYERQEKLKYSLENIYDCDFIILDSDIGCTIYLEEFKNESIKTFKEIYSIKIVGIPTEREDKSVFVDYKYKIVGNKNSSGALTYD